MSRGYGHTQRAILEAVERRPDEVIPVRVIASQWAHQAEMPFTPTVAGSFRRAAGRLLYEGAIAGWDLLIHTYFDESQRGRAARRVFCVASADMELDDAGMPTREAQAGAELIYLLLTPEFDRKETR
jgi:hypothetical protein